MAVATKAAVAGGAGLVLVVVIVVIVVVLLQLQKQTPVPTAPVIVQAPGPTPGPAPTPAPAPEPTPSPTPSPVYSGPQSSLSVAGPAPAPIIQQIGLAAPPAQQGQVAALLNTLPDLLTGIGIGLAVEIALHLDVIAFKIATRMRMTPAIAMELKAARARVAAKTLSGRMSKAFGRMGTLARAKMGLRWGKTAAQLGETVDSSTARLLAEAAQANIDNGARLAATQIAERQAAGAALKSVSFAFDAAAIVGLALDMTNTGNYTELMSTSDMRQMKFDNDSQVVNTTIACSTWPLGVACPQTPSPAPAPAPGPAPPAREGRYPMFVGPLDAWAADDLDLAISNEFVRLFTSSDPPQSVKDLIADVSSRISSDLEVDTISDTLFIMLCNQYLTSTELENIHNLAFDNICLSEGGVAFVPGNGYDKACSYATKESCHAAFPWPPPNNDDNDLTYTEWRRKPWFSSGSWTNTITPANIPTDGACIAADPSIHQMCDEDIATGTGRAKNQYIRETGECVNTRDVCRVKGVSYRDGDPPTCYVTDGQDIAELLFGTTIVRFIMSNGRLRLHPDLITTVVTVTIPPVNSGNSTVDTTVNTVSSGLASVADEIANSAIADANAIQAGLVTATNQLVNGVAGVIRDAIPVVTEIVNYVMDFDRPPLVVVDPITAQVTVNVPTVSTGSQPVDTAVNAVSSGLASAAAEISNAGITAANALQTGGATAVNTVVDFAADVVAGTVVVVLPALQDTGTQVFVQTAGTQGGILSSVLAGNAAGLTEGGYADLSMWFNGFADLYSNLPAPTQPWDHPATPKPPGVTDALLPTYVAATTSFFNNPYAAQSQCPTGSTVLANGSGYQCSFCPPGHTMLSGNACLSCPTGYTLSSDNAWCYKCPTDSSWINSTLGCVSSSKPFTEIPATRVEGSMTCPNGRNFELVNNSCSPIPPLTCPSGTQMLNRECVSCPVGASQPYIGAAGAYDFKCKSCPSGYSLNSANSYCVPGCPANSVWDASINDCKCAPGYIKSADGLSCVALSCTGRTQIQL